MYKQQMYWKNIAIQKCHKMLYRNKFLLKNDQEILQSPLTIFNGKKEHPEVDLTKNIEDFPVKKETSSI